MSKLIVANWKQQGSLDQIFTFVQETTSILAARSLEATQESALKAAPNFSGDEFNLAEGGVASLGSGTFQECAAYLPPQIIICPPAPYISLLHSQLAGSEFKMGAQDISTSPETARTGDISGEMLRDVGAEYVIIGHSERRSFNDENGKLLAHKLEHALQSGLKAIYCIGETLQERDQKRTREIIDIQLKDISAVIKSAPTAGDNLIIAYEPRWAIGTGAAPSIDYIGEIIAMVHQQAMEIFHLDSPPPVLYGGSVNCENAQNIINTPGVGGVLVGKASLKAEDFLKIAGFNRTNVSI